MKELFSTTTLLQMSPAQRARSEAICRSICGYLESIGIGLDAMPTLGHFVRSDHWEGYLALNTDNPDEYPFFAIDDKGWYASDIDFIHAYCLDGNSLSSFINSIDRDMVTPECILGQVFFYGLPSVATWFNEHDPRQAQMKAFELVLTNLIEADRSLAEGFDADEGLSINSSITPRRTVVELQLQSLYKGYYGAYRERSRPIFDEATLDRLLSPADECNSKLLAEAMSNVYRVMVKDGGLCDESALEIQQQLVVSTILNPGYFMLMSGEPIGAIRESIRIKSHVMAKMIGLDPMQFARRVEFLLLSIDPSSVEKEGNLEHCWYDPEFSPLAPLSGALIGMCARQSVPFMATFAFYRKHYDQDLTRHTIKMLEDRHTHFSSILDSEHGYHPAIDEMLQKNGLSLDAFRTVGNELLKHPGALQRYNPEGIVHSALALYRLCDGERASIDKILLPHLVRGCEQARLAIIDELDKQPVITLENLDRTGIRSSDSRALVAKLRKNDLDELFSGDLGL